MGPETEPFTHQRKVQNIGNTISDNRNYSAILATLQITSYALGV
jgi:hypothetical protein